MRKLRWHWIARYKNEKGDHAILEGNVNEIEELHSIIEKGPNWEDLIDLKVTYNLRDK